MRLQPHAASSPVFRAQYGGDGTSPLYLPYISRVSPVYLPVRSTAETAALVGAAELALLPPRAVLVNAAQPVERAVLLAPPPHHLWSPAAHSPGDIGEMYGRFRGDIGPLRRALKAPGCTALGAHGWRRGAAQGLAEEPEEVGVRPGGSAHTLSPLSRRSCGVWLGGGPRSG